MIPTKPGWYWGRISAIGSPNELWECVKIVEWPEGMMAWQIGNHEPTPVSMFSPDRFGNRIPTNDELGELKEAWHNGYIQGITNATTR